MNKLATWWIQVNTIIKRIAKIRQNLTKIYKFPDLKVGWLHWSSKYQHEMYIIVLHFSRAFQWYQICGTWTYISRWLCIKQFCPLKALNTSLRPRAKLGQPNLRPGGQMVALGGRRPKFEDCNVPASSTHRPHVSGPGYTRLILILKQQQQQQLQLSCVWHVDGL